MKYKKSTILKFLVVILVFLIAVLYFGQQSLDTFNNKQNNFVNNLTTNTEKKSIDLNKLIKKTNSKSDIQAMVDPEFIAIENVDLADDEKGFLLSINDQIKFYPISILSAHEVINDTLGGSSILVTYCPLCKTGGVFDREVANSGEVLEFGVSGLLYDSNLVMYDTKTDSLWPQAIGRAVVGDYMGQELTQIEFKQVEFSEAKNYDNALILKGLENKDYSLFMQETENGKDLLYVFEYDEKYLAVPIRGLDKNAEYQFKYNDEIFLIVHKSDEISISTRDKNYVGFYEPYNSYLSRFGNQAIIIDSFN